MKLQYIFTLLMLFSSVKCLFSQSPFSFYGASVQPGTKQHFTIPIQEGTTTTSIPITVFHGIEKGPILGITAGVHGYEYPPIIAGQRLIKSINPKLLKGTVILVQIASLGSFTKRSPFINPLDGKNLNRVFPGDIKGTITQQIANFITKNVIDKSDFFLDAHAGDAPEDLTSYAAYYSNTSMPEVSEKGRAMAASLLFDHIIVFKTDGKNYVKKDEPSLYCSAEAFKRGIPSVDIECGKLGGVEESLVNKIEKGVLNMLLHLNMTISLTKAREKDTFLYIDKRYSEESKHDGIFYPNKKSGDYVKKGMKIGEITDYFGQTLETIYAKHNGVILLILGTPPINKGDTIAVIGDVSK